MNQIPFLTSNAAEATKLWNLLLKSYTITEHNKRAGEFKRDCIILQVRTNDDQPWRIVRNKKGELQLEQYYQEMKFTTGKFYVRRKAEDLAELFKYIIRSHNKSCEYMTHWQMIKTL